MEAFLGRDGKTCEMRLQVKEAMGPIKGVGAVSALLSCMSLQTCLPAKRCTKLAITLTISCEESVAVWGNQ